MIPNFDQRGEYFDYLTARLGSGESKNIVISTTADLINRKLGSQDIVRVLDVGCFSGAMLNRIASEFAPNQRNRLRLTGVDYDSEVMNIGAGKYPDVTYVSADLKATIPLVSQYDVVVFSNVLHEVISGDDGDVNKSVIYPVFSRIASLLNHGGSVIILDGLKPKDGGKDVSVEFQQENQRQTFEWFSQHYKATKIPLVTAGERIVTTTIGSLAAFLTKARYMDKPYWESESKQLYQYFTLEDFEQMMEANSLVLDRVEPQLFTGEEISDIVANTIPQIEIPAKNVLLVASSKK